MSADSDDPSIEVKVSTHGGDIPFSVGYLANELLPIGIAPDRAYQDAYAISQVVADRGKKLYSSSELMEIVTNWYQDKDPKLSTRIEVLQNDMAELKPLVILFGGVTGIGKSTLAHLFATRMGVKSIIGTDLIREVMRVTISQDLMPTLHTSSYVAYKQLDTTFRPAMSDAVVGFEEQARSVIVGIEAAIQQAVSDNEILILEGVHLVPGLIGDKLMEREAIMAFQCILKDEEEHNSRLSIRENKSEGRGTNYSKYFKEIREIQDYLIELADKSNVPIINLVDDEEALLEIINYIWEHRTSKSSS